MSHQDEQHTHEHNPRRLWMVVLSGVWASMVCAQSNDVDDKWFHSPGGGFTLNLQEEVGLEASFHWMWSTEFGGSDHQHVYAIGPDLAVGSYFGHAGYWGQRLGLRQMALYEGVLGLSLTGGVENYTARFDMDDTRWYLQGGPTFAGLVSLEYGHSVSLGDANTRASTDRFLVRLELNIAVLARLFERVPIS